MFDKLKETARKLSKHDGGMMEVVDIVMALVMVIVVGAIGIFIADTVTTEVGTPTNATLATMFGNILNAGNTGSSFVVILIIAFIGAIAISYMFGIMGKRRR